MVEETSHPLEELGQQQRTLDPCILVIFGATGDLTARKLFPAIYNLKREGLLPSNFACVGFARREKSHEEFRKEMKTAVSEFSRVKPIEEPLWSSFQDKIYYYSASFDDREEYKKFKGFLDNLDAQLGTKGNRVFYLSTQPSYFPLIIEHLHYSGLMYHFQEVKNKWSRVIIEKPFGHDLNSAYQLQAELLKHLSEQQIFRIDHYLGKETVQNLLAFRFSNCIFESLWNNRYIDHIQITAAEEIGIGTRGKFYEEEGLVRDFIQNHMMQLLTLVAMEPPHNLSADAVRDEKVKVLECITPFSKETFDTHAVRGQYAKGFISGQTVKGYREEGNVSKDSNVETYAALKFFVNNWRWEGVPFYLRGGKRLPKRATEIAVIFKTAPGTLFQLGKKKNEPNTLAIRIQPNEGISLKMNCKIPGPTSIVQPVKMDFSYGSFFGLTPPEAYERLLCDCIYGDSTLFARQDEVFNSWRILTPLLEYWGSKKQDFPNYPAGSWGPKQAEELLAKDGRQWRLL
jgi:glucose-6-phosphate 1-dehydrogenase